MNKTLSSLVLVFCLAVTFGCSRKNVDKELASVTPITPVAKVVNLGIWSNYLSPETIEEFRKRTGIEIKVSNYSSNEELLAKIQAGGADFDVIVPSDYMVFAMARMNLLRPLDYTKLPHAKGLDPRYLKKTFDPQNQFSVPYDWGTTGIAINRKLYKGTVKGWKDVFTKPDLAGKIALLDDPREVIGAALKSQGKSLNTRKPEELAEAKALLIKSRPRVKLFSSEALITLTGGEAAVSQAYVSDALQARKKMDGQVDFVLPEEGGTLWIDNLVMPARAPHPDSAHVLIDFLLEPQTVLNTVNQLFVSPANHDALGLLPAALRSDPAMFPKDSVLKKFEMLEDLGEGIKDWDRVWTEVKATD